MKVVETEKLEHSFDGTSSVLKGITLSFEESTATAIMGPSESGKSTLLNCMSGITRPSSGDVTYRGTSLRTMKRHKLERLRRSSWGYIFQSYNLIDALSAKDNVKLPSLFSGEKVSDEQANIALSDVGLDGLADRYPDQLSGGQRQRVAIARAMLSHKDVVFADEPTGALDSDSRDDVMTNLSRLPDKGSTVIIVTHDPVVAAKAQRVVFLYDGTVAADQPCLTAEQITETLLGLENRR